jgi:hypothetical protein
VYVYEKCSVGHFVTLLNCHLNLFLQSAAHVQCSESFYKEWIETDMSTKGPTDRETMRKTYDALIKMQKEEQVNLTYLIISHASFS